MQNFSNYVGLTCHFANIIAKIFFNNYWDALTKRSPKVKEITIGYSNMYASLVQNSISAMDINEFHVEANKNYDLHVRMGYNKIAGVRNQG